MAQIIDIGERSKDELSVEQEGGLVQRWLTGLTEFFTQARMLETEARTALDDAKVLTVPTSLEQDRWIVAWVKERQSHKSTISEHWDICGQIHRLHRSATAARDRGIKMDDEAITIGTRLHNAWDVAEKRREQEERDRQRREAEERERQRLAAEAADLERKQLEAEAASEGLSEREKTYASLVAIGIDPVSAAKLAGFKDARESAARLSKSKKVADAVRGMLDAAALARAAAAKRAEPVRVDEPVVTEAQVATKGRSTWKARILNADQFLGIVLDPKQRTQYGIPSDVIMIDESRLNEYAKDLKTNMNRWPGVEAYEKRGI